MTNSPSQDDIKELTKALNQNTILLNEVNSNLQRIWNELHEINFSHLSKRVNVMKFTEVPIIRTGD